MRIAGETGGAVMRMNEVCLRLWAVVIVLVYVKAGAARGAEEHIFGVRVRAVAEHFTWHEEEAGTRLLEEEGPIGGLAGDLLLRFPNHMHFSLGGQVYSGSVDYDGSTQDGTPTETTVDYNGVRWHGLLGFDVVPQSALAVSPCLSIGGRAWIRDINDSPEGQGYEEEWLTIQGGAGLEIAAGNVTTCRFHARVMALYPLYNNAQYDLSEFDMGNDIEVEPGRRLTFRGEAGIRIRHFFAAVHYEQLDFAPSDREPTRGGVVWQPRSEGTVAGVSLGMEF